MPAYAGTPIAAGMPGTTSNGMPLLVQEQRFLAAAVEHERVAPLQPDDDLALACLLDEQAARSRPDRAACGAAAPDVDAFGVRPRASRSSRAWTWWS